MTQLAERNVTFPISYVASEFDRSSRAAAKPFFFLFGPERKIWRSDICPLPLKSPKWKLK